jgi:predicted anti-sigma-YlaC factor YlaD
MRLMRAFPTSCDRARESISLALDDELVEVDRARLAAHTGSCADCRAFEADARAVSRKLRSAALEQPAYAVILPRTRRIRIGTLQAGAAAAIIAVVAASSLFQGLGQRTATSQTLRLSPNAAFRAGDYVEPIRSPQAQQPQEHRVAV